MAQLPSRRHRRSDGVHCLWYGSQKTHISKSYQWRLVVALNIYAVVFTKGAEKGSSLLEDAYENAYKVHENVVLVASAHLSNEIANASALTKEKKDEDVRGAVFKLNGSYTGFAPSALWEWLENVEESG